MALVSDDVGLSLCFLGRHPGSSLPALRVYGKNRPTCPTPPAAVHTLGSHGYPRDKNHPASEGVWAGGCTRFVPWEQLTSLCGSGSREKALDSCCSSAEVTPVRV